MSIRQGNGKRNGPILLYMIGEVGEREPYPDLDTLIKSTFLINYDGEYE